MDPTPLGADDDPLVNTVIAERYKLLRRVGEGGMGSVYLAEHLTLRKRVALKFLHPEMSAAPHLVARFTREAIAAASLDHPNIAAAHDFGKTPDGRFFLVLDYVDGVSLRDLLQSQKVLEPARALHITRHIANALHRAHALEIVHRDLKPENIMLIERDGDPDFARVIDFGIAKISAAQLGEGAPALTQAGVIFGTPDYMAPEQCLGGTVDYHADLYSLAVITFEMLVGRRPFVEDDMMTLLARHLSAPIPSARLSAGEQRLPHAVDAVFERALAKSPRQRFDSARGFVDALAEALDAPLDAPSAPPPIAPFSHPDVTPPDAEALSFAPHADAAPDAAPSPHDAALPDATPSDATPSDAAPTAVTPDAPTPDAPTPDAPPARASLATVDTGPKAVVPRAELLLHEGRAWVAQNPARARRLGGLVAAVAAVAMSLLVLASAHRPDVRPATLAPTLPSPASAPPGAPHAADRSPHAPPAPSSGPIDPETMHLAPALQARIDSYRALPEVAPLVAPTAGGGRARIASLVALAEHAPDNPIAQYVLGAALARLRAPEALGCYQRAVQRDPALARDVTLVGDVVRAYSAAREAPAVAETLLRGPLAPGAFYMLVDVAANHGPGRARAAALFDAPPFSQWIDPTGRGLIALGAARGCAEERAAIEALGRDADERALPYLRRINIGTGCGILGLAHCNTCLAGVLPAAIRSITARTSRPR